MVNTNKIVLMSASIIMLLHPVNLFAMPVSNWAVGELAMMADTIIIVEAQQFEIKLDGRSERSLSVSFDKFKVLKGKPLDSPIELKNVFGIERASENFVSTFPEGSYFLIMGKSSGSQEITFPLAPYQKQMIELPKSIPFEAIGSYSDLLNALLSLPEVLQNPDFISFFSGLDQSIRNKIDPKALNEIHGSEKSLIVSALQKGNLLVKDALINPLIQPKEAEVVTNEVVKEFVRKLNGLDLNGLSEVAIEGSPFYDTLLAMRADNEIKTFSPIVLEGARPPDITVTSDQVKVVLNLAREGKPRKMLLTLKLDEESRRLKIFDAYLDK